MILSTKIAVGLLLIVSKASCWGVQLKTVPSEPYQEVWKFFETNTNTDESQEFMPVAKGLPKIIIKGPTMQPQMTEEHHFGKRCTKTIEKTFQWIGIPITSDVMGVAYSGVINPYEWGVLQAKLEIKSEYGKLFKKPIAEIRKPIQMDGKFRFETINMPTSGGGEHKSMIEGMKLFPFFGKHTGRNHTKPYVGMRGAIGPRHESQETLDLTITLTATAVQVYRKRIATIIIVPSTYMRDRLAEACCQGVKIYLIT